MSSAFGGQPLVLGPRRVDEVHPEIQAARHGAARVRRTTDVVTATAPATATVAAMASSTPGPSPATQREIAPCTPTAADTTGSRVTLP